MLAQSCFVCYQRASKSTLKNQILVRGLTRVFWDSNYYICFSWPWAVYIFSDNLNTATSVLYLKTSVSKIMLYWILRSLLQPQLAWIRHWSISKTKSSHLALSVLFFNVLMLQSNHCFTPFLVTIWVFCKFENYLKSATINCTQK